MYPRMTHLALHVVDLSACIAFYQTYCNMEVVHDRSKHRQRIVWLAEPGRKEDFIIVMMDGGSGHIQAARDYRHFGFAVETHSDVDRIAIQAKREGCLVWDAVEEPYPVGYYCGVRDPDGNCVEFSFGQPIGPGSKQF
jgi:catechol 2,3-dioxygenase-like lactoylglutathione lyase family enzyme